MVAKQLSIFLENKSGRLTEVTEVLAKENINLSALCIAENADFGILRGIVSDPDKAYKALKDNHFASTSVTWSALAVRMCRELWQKCWDSCRQKGSLLSICIRLPIITWQTL